MYEHSPCRYPVSHAGTSDLGSSACSQRPSAPGYMCFCAYYSLFRLGMFSFYQLVPRHTDSFSLLVNAALTCRYSAGAYTRSLFSST